MNSKEIGWLLQANKQVLGSCILIGGAVSSDQRFQRQVCGHPLPLMPKGERWRQRERCRQKGSMLIGGAWVVVINDKGGDCWWNCHWCQHGLDVIDATTLLNMLKKSLDPHWVIWWPCNPWRGHGALIWWWWNPWTLPWYDQEAYEDLKLSMKTLIWQSGSHTHEFLMTLKNGLK